MRDGACRWSQNRPPVGHSRNHADGWSGAQIGRRRVVRPYFKRSAGPAILCAGLCTGGFETRPYVCLFGTRCGGGTSLRVRRRGLACGGRLVGPGGDFALGCSGGAGTGGFETRPYVCLFGTRCGGGASLRVRRRGLACGGRLVGPGGDFALGCSGGAGTGGFETRPYVCLPGPRRGGGASLRVRRWGLACGGRPVKRAGGDFALGCSGGAGAGGFETRP